LVEIHLAPMLGITDVWFRNAFSKHFGGLSGAIAPFIKLNQHGEFKQSKFKELNPKLNKRLKTIPQIMTNSPSSFSSFYTKLAEAYNYDEMNWNLGCPSPTSAGRGMGCGLMPDVERVDRVLDEFFTHHKSSLSVKTRLGFEDDLEIIKLAETLNRYPLKEVIIHPRTGKQGYGGDVSFDGFIRASKAIKHDVSYSGDLCSSADIKDVVSKCENLKKVYVGRGLLKNPYMLESKSQLSQSTYVDFLKDLASSYIEIKLGEKQALIRLKSLWYYFADHHDICKKTTKKIRKSNELSVYFDIVGQAVESALID
jgi:tRNA-dihydrouridine synthase